MLDAISGREKYTLNQRIKHALLLMSKLMHIFICFDKSCTHILKFDDGVGQTNLSLADMENFIALYPCAEEQKTIGQFFKQLDETLVLQQQQLQTLKRA